MGKTHSTSIWRGNSICVKSAIWKYPESIHVLWQFRPKGRRTEQCDTSSRLKQNGRGKIKERHQVTELECVHECRTIPMEFIDIEGMSWLLLSESLSAARNEPPWRFGQNRHFKQPPGRLGDWKDPGAFRGWKPRFGQMVFLEVVSAKAGRRSFNKFFVFYISLLSKNNAQPFVIWE